MRLFFFSISTDPQDYSIPRFEERMARCVNNTGNLLYTTALMRQLRYDSIFQSYHVKENDPTAYDFMVFPMSNHLNSGWKLRRWVEEIKDIQLPVLVVGLGAQNDTPQTIVHPKSSTLRFFKILAGRTRTIGVRGLYTQRVLAHYGIHNTRVIGCPSAFWHCEPQIKLRWKDDAGEKLRLAFNGTRYELGQFFSRYSPRHQAERWLYQNAYALGADYIYQSEKQEAEILRTGSMKILSEPAGIALQKLYQAPTAEALGQYVLEHGHIFYDASQWVQHMGRYDFVIGTRLHGCMAALQAGTPALLITHDSRTQEMAEFLQMPHLSAAAFAQRNFSIETLYQFSRSFPFESVYPEKYRNYRQFLDENAVPHRLPPPVHADTSPSRDIELSLWREAFLKNLPKEAPAPKPPQKRLLETFLKKIRYFFWHSRMRGEQTRYYLFGIPIHTRMMRVGDIECYNFWRKPVKATNSNLLSNWHAEASQATSLR